MHPTRLGPYTISAPIGRGGMGSVYEAVDATTGHTVAVKTLAAHLGDDPSLRRRFAAEIETLKSLRHPCIVQLLAFGEEDGQPYFAMELVRGKSLEQLLRSGRRFSWHETVETALDVARALKSAHDHGVVHRDLKPANLLFLDEPAADVRVKLADFGIARLFGASGQTMAGMIVGTAEYMAPEQAAGGAIDHRVDLYALGLVMFAMLTGRPPFQGSQVTEVLHRQRSELAPRVSSRVADIPRELDELIHRLLSKDPAKRPASALAVGRLLSAIAALDGTAATPGTIPGGTGTASPTQRAVSRTEAGSHATTYHDAAAGEAPTDPGIGGPAGDAGIDLLAATQDFTAAATSPPEAAVIAGDAPAPAGDLTLPLPTKASVPESLARRPTEPATDGGHAVTSRANRFTTVEELTAAARAEAEAAARRENRLRMTVAAVIVAVLAAVGYLLLRPETADDLHADILAIAQAPDADLRDARPLIDRFLARFPNDSRVAGIRDLDRSLDLDLLERRAGRRRRRDDPDMAPLEREYRAAMEREEESPLACTAALEAILAIHADDAPPPGKASDGAPEDDPALWLALVRRQIARLEPLAAKERAEDVTRAAATLAEAARLATEAAAAEGVSREALEDRRSGLLRGIVEIYGSRPHVAEAVAEAKALLAAP
jgi:eukaryotic-like serine/threonine-protein kinase